MPGRSNRPMGKIPSWQKYQADLQRVKKFNRLKKKTLRYFLLVLVLIFVVYGGAACLSRIAGRYAPLFSSSNHQVEADSSFEPNLAGKKEVQAVLANTNLMNIEEETVSVNYHQHKYQVDTSIEVPLQKYLLNKLDLSTSRYIGIVIMNPVTGRILAMTGFDRTDKSNNTCVDSKFPAASIFKIVTVAAGIEKCGFSSTSNFTFNGGKYTLYKYQLKDRKNRWTNTISLRDSFAQSVNPVFGKIGANYLGKEYLEEYAGAFGFNQPINFEIPLSQSRVIITDEVYQWAEVACGFNRDTVMSPLHGAILCGAIVNGGVLMEPTIVDRIYDENGDLYYKSEPRKIGLAVTPKVSRQISEMMKATIKSGTSRKAFRSARRDKVLKKLVIGGKTGSISSRKVKHVRYDWFVGFAADRKGDEKLAVSVMVAHQEYIGKRAGYYARIIMKEYFRNYFENKEAVMHTRKQSKSKGDENV